MATIPIFGSTEYRPILVIRVQSKYASPRYFTHLRHSFY